MHADSCIAIDRTPQKPGRVKTKRNETMSTASQDEYAADIISEPSERPNERSVKVPRAQIARTVFRSQAEEVMFHDLVKQANAAFLDGNHAAANVLAVKTLRIKPHA